MKQSPDYCIVLSQVSLEKIMLYKNALLSGTIEPGAYLKKSLDILINAGTSLEQASNEQFIGLLLSTKKPKIFAESEIKGDGTDWNNTELQILGDINITMPVKIYDNGVWAPSDKNFHTHVQPLKGELLFTPGPLLKAGGMQGVPPDFQEIVMRGTINQDKYNQLLDRRLTPLLYHVNESAKKEEVSAVITLPGIGCGAFAGKFRGKMGEHLNKALQYIIENNAKNFTNISCIYYDPFDECKNQENLIEGIRYRVRPTVHNPNKSQLLNPIDYQELGDNFSKSKLYKIVAWDHVSFPGNDYFLGSRNTDDGVAAAATNSMEIITGIKGKYDTGYYLPPEEKINWRQVVRDNKISLQAKDNVKILTSDGLYINLIEFEKNINNSVEPGSRLLSTHKESINLSKQDQSILDTAKKLLNNSDSTSNSSNNSKTSKQPSLNWYR